MDRETLRSGKGLTVGPRDTPVSRGTPVTDTERPLFCEPTDTNLLSGDKHRFTIGTPATKYQKNVKRRSDNDS